MRGIRLWILVVALGCFVAGMIVGTTFLGHHSSEAALAVPMQDRNYADDLVEKYQLTAAQLRSVQLVLQNQRDEEAAIRAGIEFAQLPESLRNRLLALNGLTRQRIRALLDPQQRERFDLALRPIAPGDPRHR
jgi:hypothetical protein